MMPLPLPEAQRQALFPITRDRIFLAHAAVTALPQPVADASIRHLQASAANPQELGETLRDIQRAREVCASFIEADRDEVALLGPTSLGLSLFANGLAWEQGDEVVCYHGDYPANVYPWLELQRRGVTVRYLEPAAPGEITPELVAAALTPRTKLVALASCHFFTGYRIDVDAIGQLLHARGVLFSLDGIQTLGAFPLSMRHVDFMSADAHKWLLGPLAIGIVCVKKERFERLRPTLIGAWNVISPNFIAQEEIRFHPTAQRYEPGVLNISGIYGMVAAIELINSAGRERVGERILELKRHLLGRLEPLGFSVLGPKDGPNASGITTVRHETRVASELARALEAHHVIASLRHAKDGTEYLRFSPHFYNTEDELDRVAEILRGAL